ncbi:MAG: hypothetical protein AAB263_10970 [Planctomycetota bacterium]
MDLPPSKTSDVNHDDRRFVETIGAHEVIRPPPAPENANDLDAMNRLEGQALGRMGERPRSWFMIVCMWLSFAAPLLFGVLGFFLWADVATASWPTWLGVSFISVVCVLVHVPIVSAVLVKRRQRIERK